MKLILENVRCFYGRHEISIKPLTIVTGENSSGKTTFLGMLSAMWDLSYPLQPNFNAPPYNLGNFDTIATRIGRNTRSKHFLLGYDQNESADRLSVKRFEAKYTAFRGQIRLATFTATLPEWHLSLEFEPHGREPYGRCIIRLNDKVAELDLQPQERSTGVPFQAPPLVQLLLQQQVRTTQTPERDGSAQVLFETVNKLWPVLYSRSAALSVAPIRTRPERTYSQIAETFKPTGDHIPFLLNELLRDETADRDKLVQALGTFGEESHLFKRFEVKHLGKRPTDPFELMVTVANSPDNLVDVGYGVSQSLPVVVQSSLITANQTLLLQQPEVHLHPRAQAALGTFFARVASTGTGRLLVETHSDYMIDRIRQEVAAGRIAAEKVLILYFHRHLNRTTPHQISIDEDGNLLNVPPYYREFFLKEELNLLNRGREKS